MFDPYYTPSRQDYADVIDNGVLNYVISISNLMTPYLDANNLDANMLMMEEEINNIVMRRGRWGDLIETFQRSLPKPPETLSSNTDKEFFTEQYEAQQIILGNNR